LVRGLLESRRRLKSGTIVDATTIEALPATKNESGARDPEMKQGKKNWREWRFGMKAHVGTDQHGIVHSLVTIPANAADIGQMLRVRAG
jgi:IS5 family transposase